MKRDTCPKCHCKAYTKQGFEKTKYKGSTELVYKERRQCKYCGTRYTVEPKERNNPACIYCGSTHTRKEGFSKLGVRKYYCTSCKKHFQDTYMSDKKLPYRISEHNRKMVVKYHTGGFSNRFIAKLLGIGETSVKRILDKYFRLQEINEESKSLKLTKIEKQIYTLLNENKVIPISKLTDTLDTDTDTLRVHIHNLKGKLEDSSNTNEIVSIYGKGYKLYTKK